MLQLGEELVILKIVSTRSEWNKADKTKPEIKSFMFWLLFEPKNLLQSVTAKSL